MLSTAINPFFKVVIAGVEFSFPIFNASGPLCTSEEELHNLAESKSGAIVTKSCTLNYRQGNALPRYSYNENGFFSVNSTGLANLGWLEYLDIVERLSSTTDKPIIVSIAGMNMADNLTIIRGFQEQGLASLLEINLSCPNIAGKMEVAFELDTLPESLEQIMALKKTIPMGIKLPYYPSRLMLERVARILEAAQVDFISTTNSLTGLDLNPIDGKSSIKPNNGIGGCGGNILPFALGQVAQFSQHFGGKIPIIGVGGIRNGEDVIRYFRAGASGVQLGTHFMENGPGVFEDLHQQVLDFRDLHHPQYKSILNYQNTISDPAE